MITLHPNLTLLMALEFAKARGMHLVTDGRRIAAMPDGQRRPGWRRFRTGVRRIAG